MQHITFLGTSAGSPSRYRNVTSQAITLESGRVWLLDCGEGTQQRILSCGSVKSSKIDLILITHLHGDHCFGLPGLLATMSLHMSDREGGKPVILVGPEGIEEMVRVSLNLSKTFLNFEIHFIELKDSLHHASCGQISSPSSSSSSSCGGGGISVGTFDGIHIGAYALKHSVPCWGYILQEPLKRGKIDMKKAKEFGIVGKLVGEIVQSGFLWVKNQQIFLNDISSPPQPGKKILLLGDTCDSSSMILDAQNCDLLVHEATFDKTMLQKALETGHSTSAMAGDFARKVKAKNLILTHFSARYCKNESNPLGQESLTGTDEIHVESLRKEAEKQVEEIQTCVFAAKDFDCFEYKSGALSLLSS